MTFFCLLWRLFHLTTSVVCKLGHKCGFSNVCILSVAVSSDQFCDQLHYSVEKIEQLWFKACHLKISTTIIEHFLCRTCGYTLV